MMCVCVSPVCVCVVQDFVRDQDWVPEQELVHVNKICSLKDVPFNAAARD